MKKEKNIYVVNRKEIRRRISVIRRKSGTPRIRGDLYFLHEYPEVINSTPTSAVSEGSNLNCV